MTVSNVPAPLPVSQKSFTTGTVARQMASLSAVATPTALKRWNTSDGLTRMTAAITARLNAAITQREAGEPPRRAPPPGGGGGPGGGGNPKRPAPPRPTHGEK